MDGLAKACVGLAVLGFVGAAALTLMGGEMMGVTAEGASRASSNLALIAIGLFVGFKDEGAAGA